MKGTETGSEKVRKISEALRKETLEPALVEAEGIVQKAKLEAEAIISAAKKERDDLVALASVAIEHEKKIFQSALAQAGKQAVLALKQLLEEKLFNQELTALVKQKLQAPEVLAKLITALIQALEKEGTSAHFSAYIPAQVPAREVNALLAKEILEKLQEKSVLLAPIGGGIEVKIHQGNITLDLSDAAIKELLASYIRKDFRALFFASAHD